MLQKVFQTSKQLIYLVVFLGDPGGNTLTVEAAVRAAGAVSAAALHQEAAGPEDGVRPRQLLTQRHGEVARCAAVQPDVLPQQVEIDSSWKTESVPSETNQTLHLLHNIKPALPLGFLFRMKDFPSTCHVGLYSSSMSTCHLSGSRYFITSSTVLSPATASDKSSMPCRDDGRTAGSSGSDTACGDKVDNK